MEMIYWIWILMLMLFLHTVYDFHIQGILAQMKQRSWWYNQPEFRSRYRFDYIPVLLIHGFEWSFIIHIPIFYYIGISPIIFLSVIVNAILHSYIDHLKCNTYQLNLAQDQILHVLQLIFVTLYLFTIYG